VSGERAAANSKMKITGRCAAVEDNVFFLVFRKREMSYYLRGYHHLGETPVKPG
jgi:hypothetical protein